MAADYLTHIDNEELIELYNEIGDKKTDDSEYQLLPHEFLVISAMSKRKLIHRSRYNRGLPKSKAWQ